MKQIICKIVEPLGLHAIPSSILAGTASKYKSSITITTSNGHQADLKSIMNITSLGIKQGYEVIIKAVGADEQEAIEDIKKVLETNLII
ncbi:MAG: HPr family phosphocarrier protein [Metamycoplasmataceae bacterium]